MTLENDLQQLANYEAFANFLAVVESLREECIAEMHEATSENIQQLSGRILTYDQLLQMCDWKKIQMMHPTKVGLV
tara:strand:+ start:732 stop:959 length:228 start_codon:yes stop_codon:yes gene_type:complete